MESQNEAGTVRSVPVSAFAPTDAAAVVDGVIYVFGGSGGSTRGRLFGDLTAFVIASRRWYTSQNMGTSPSPRSGHSMCVYLWLVDTDVAGP